MALRFLLRYLTNNEKLIQMLADSYPIRKAARFTARMLMQAKDFKEQHISKVNQELVQEFKNGNPSSLLRNTFQKIKKIFEDQSKRT